MNGNGAEWRSFLRTNEDVENDSNDLQNGRADVPLMFAARGRYGPRNLVQPKHVIVSEEILFPDLRSYYVGCVFYGNILHVQNNQNGECFVVDIQRAMPEAEKLFGPVLQPLIHRPRYYEMFGYEHDGFVRRAIRMDRNGCSTNTDVFRATLIDTGAEVVVDNLSKLFKVTEAASRIPTYGMNCIVQNAVGNLDELLHKDSRFKVMAIKGQFLYVELLSNNPFFNGGDNVATPASYSEHEGSGWNSTMDALYVNGSGTPPSSNPLLRLDESNDETLLDRQFDSTCDQSSVLQPQNIASNNPFLVDIRGDTSDKSESDNENDHFLGAVLQPQNVDATGTNWFGLVQDSKEPFAVLQSKAAVDHGKDSKKLKAVVQPESSISKSTMNPLYPVRGIEDDRDLEDTAATSKPLVDVDHGHAHAQNLDGRNGFLQSPIGAKTITKNLFGDKMEHTPSPASNNPFLVDIRGDTSDKSESDNENDHFSGANGFSIGGDSHSQLASATNPFCEEQGAGYIDSTGLTDAKPINGDFGASPTNGTYSGLDIPRFDESERFQPLDFLHIDDFVKISVMHVVDVEHFYAQIFEQESTEKYKFLEMHFALGRRSHVQMKEPPEMEELVLVKFKDGLMYRAKVIVRYDVDNFKVFYVDFGNCSNVHRSDIYEWETPLNDVPFKAFHCRLQNVRCIREYDFEARAFLLNQVLNKQLRAQVKKIDPQQGIIWLELFDYNGNNISQTICSHNHANWVDDD